VFRFKNATTDGDEMRRARPIVTLSISPRRISEYSVVRPICKRVIVSLMVSNCGTSSFGRIVGRSFTDSAGWSRDSIEAATIAEIVITIEREPGAPTVGIHSEEPGIVVIRDASASNGELLAAYAVALEDLEAEARATARH
jgi:hypothetical protein